MIYLCKMRFSLLFTLLLVAIGSAFGQKPESQKYIATYKDIAIEQMQRYKIPASITLAQGIIESGNGNGRLAVKGNNHFGIKCGANWNGARIHHDDDLKGECFRKYRSAEESYIDHSLFLINGKRYASLFDLEITDYQGWARGLKSAGYATNPQYANILIRTVEDNNLAQYDRKAINPNDGLSKKPHRTGRYHGKNNDVKYIVALADDSFARIANEMRVPLDKLLEYNDLDYVIPTVEGVAIYLKAKKSKSASVPYHIVADGETMHSISQQYGIKLKSLKKMNRKLKGREPNVGYRLRTN